MIFDIQDQGHRACARGPGQIDVRRDRQSVVGVDLAYDRRGREYSLRLRANPATRASVRELHRVLRAWLHGHEVTVDGLISRLPGSLVWGTP